MTIKSIKANNRKKAFEAVLSDGRKFTFPYSKARLKPTVQDPIRKIYPDPETGFDAFTYELASGVEDSIVVDQLLHYARDPEYVRKMMLHKLSIEAQKRVKKLKVSKREIIRRMGVSPTQFYRLIDQTNVNKTIDQMLKLLSALDCEVRFVVHDRAA